MSAVFWAWFFGLSFAFTAGMFLVVAIGGRQKRDELGRKLDIAEIVTNTLAQDLAEALHIGQASSETPVFDASVTSIFRKQLAQPRSEWPL